MRKVENHWSRRICRSLANSTLRLTQTAKLLSLAEALRCNFKLRRSGRFSLRLYILHIWGRKRGLPKEVEMFNGVPRLEFSLLIFRTLPRESDRKKTETLKVGVTQCAICQVMGGQPQPGGYHEVGRQKGERCMFQAPGGGKCIRTSR